MSFKTIKLERDTYEKRALSIAQSEISRDPEVEAVLVDGENICDLCINEYGEARKCTDAEWTAFFYANIYNPNKL